MDAKDKVVQFIEAAKSCGLKMKLRSMKALEAPEEPVVLSGRASYSLCFRACIIYDYARTGRTASTAVRTVKR